MIRVEKPRRLAAVLALVACAASASSRAAPVVETDPEWLPYFWAGEYTPASDPHGRVLLEAAEFPAGLVIRTSLGWGAVGFCDGDHFEGVLRSADLQGAPLPGPLGTIVFEVRDRGRISATWRRGGLERTETWVRRQVARNEAPDPDDYRYVEELPQAVEKPAPAYPPEARKAGIEGTVLVQVLVGKDGRARDTKVVKSIPALDAAAVAAVKRWRFKPGLSNGEPITVWVAVPVRFSLKR